MEPTQSQEPIPQASAPKFERPGFVHRLAGWIVPERNPAGAVYGLITVGALLAAESGLRDTYPETVGSAAIAVTLYWFAHSYADVLGLRLLEQRRLEWEELWRTFVQDWAIAKGAAAPLLALLVAWAAGASQTTAVAAGVWTVVGSLVAFEVAAGVRSRAKPAALMLDVLVGATLGLGILALRVVLH
jgi:signal transduction histidine kinase